MKTTKKERLLARVRKEMFYDLFVDKNWDLKTVMYVLSRNPKSKITVKQIENALKEQGLKLGKQEKTNPFKTPLFIGSVLFIIVATIWTLVITKI